MKAPESGASPRDRCRAQSQVLDLEPGAETSARCIAQSQVQASEPVFCMTVTTEMEWYRKGFIGAQRLRITQLIVGLSQPDWDG